MAPQTNQPQVSPDPPEVQYVGPPPVVQSPPEIPNPPNMNGTGQSWWPYLGWGALFGAGGVAAGTIAGLPRGLAAAGTDYMLEMKNMDPLRDATKTAAATRYGKEAAEAIGIDPELGFSLRDPVPVDRMLPRRLGWMAALPGLRGRTWRDVLIISELAPALVVYLIALYEALSLIGGFAEHVERFVDFMHTLWREGGEDAASDAAEEVASDAALSLSTMKGMAHAAIVMAEVMAEGGQQAAGGAAHGGRARRLQMRRGGQLDETSDVFNITDAKNSIDKIMGEWGAKLAQITANGEVTAKEMRQLYGTFAKVEKNFDMWLFYYVTDYYATKADVDAMGAHVKEDYATKAEVDAMRAAFHTLAEKVQEVNPEGVRNLKRTAISASDTASSGRTLSVLALISAIASNVLVLLALAGKASRKANEVLKRHERDAAHTTAATAARTTAAAAKKSPSPSVPSPARKGHRPPPQPRRRR